MKDSTDYRITQLSFSKIDKIMKGTNQIVREHEGHATLLAYKIQLFLHDLDISPFESGYWLKRVVDHERDNKSINP